MKKLLGITLGVMMLVGLIASPAMAVTFTTYSQPGDGDYLTATTKIDISGLTYGSSYSSISDGALTVSFDTPMNKRGPVPTGWATWSSPPWSETANPHVLFTNGPSSLTMTLSQPVTTFGFELEPNPFLDKDYDVDFILMSGPTVVGNITITVNGNAGARLFAASITDGVVDKIVIDGEADFAIAQVRYAYEPDVDIDIKPWSDPNSINPKSNGVIAVAILGTDILDVTQIVPSSIAVFFGPGSATPRHDITDPAVFADHIVYPYEPDPIGNPGYYVTANDDTIPDLVFHFRQKDTELDHTYTDAELDGSFQLGGLTVTFTASDSVRVLDKNS